MREIGQHKSVGPLKTLDRVLAALYHEEPDLVPCLWAVASGLRSLQAELSRRGIRLPRDMVGVGGVLGESEVVERGPDYEVLRSPFGDLRRLSYKVEYGYSELIRPAVSGPEALGDMEQPKLDMERVKKVREAVKEHKDYFTYIGHDSPFDSVAQHLRGFEPFLTDMVKDPVFAKKLLDFAMEPQVEMAKILIEETGVHGVWLTGDLGNPHGPFISPMLYREILFPWDRRIADAYHRLGAFVFLHSHGNLNLILDDLIRAGFDGLNPIDEAEGMDLAAIKEKNGDRVTLVPQPSTYRLEKMPKGLIEGYVAAQVGAAAHGGGLIYYGVIVNMPLENAEHYVKVFEKLRKYPRN